MALDRTKTVRGALAGAAAAGVWSAQSQLDRRVFGVDYLDEALLGKAVTRGPAWPVAGVALHLANGALFGAVYANVAPRVPLPSWARGPVAGLAEHLATWPLTALVGRAHPARDEFPALWGSSRGVRAGDMAPRAVRGRAGRARAPPERRGRRRAAGLRAVVSSNGHGNIEHAVGVR